MTTWFVVRLTVQVIFCLSFILQATVRTDVETDKKISILSSFRSLLSGATTAHDLCKIADDGNYSSLIIRSPFIPGEANYSPNKNCSKTIRAVTPGAKLVVTFDSVFNIEDSEGCVRDYLVIQDAEGAESLGLRCCGKSCNQGNPIDSDYWWISHSDSITVKFVSDHVIQKAGFIMQVAETIQPVCSSNESEPNILATSTFVMALKTGSSNNCSVKIYGQKPSDFLRISIRKFRLPYSGPNCIYDRLEFQFVYNARKLEDIKLMCGIQSATDFILSTNQAMVRYVNNLSPQNRAFTFYYYSLPGKSWTTLQPPHFYYLRQQTVNIAAHEMSPNQRYSLPGTSVTFTIYEFKFLTIIGKKLSAKIACDPKDPRVRSCSGVRVFFSDRFTYTTPATLINLQNPYVHEVKINGITHTEVVDTLSFQMIIYLVTFDDKLQRGVHLEVRANELDVYTGHQDLPVSKNANFYLPFTSLTSLTDKRQNTVQMLIRTPEAPNVRDVYWNITSFELDSQYSDESCNKTGLFIIKRGSNSIESRYGPFCSASSLPVSVLSEDSVVFLLIYYFHDPNIINCGPPGGAVFTYSIGAYPCTMVDLSQVESRKEIFILKCLTIMSEVEVVGKRIKTIEIISRESLLVFAKFTSSNLLKLTEDQEKDIAAQPLQTKFNCQSTISIQRRTQYQKYSAIVTFSSDCDFSATFWTLHLEAKCRTRVMHHNIAAIGSPMQTAISMECGILESPGFPFPYEKYEKPVVWVFNSTGLSTESSYYKFFFSEFKLDNCFNSVLTILEFVSNRHRTIYQCNYHSGSHLYTLSTKEVYFMFQANKISYQESKSESARSQYTGFEIRYRLVHDESKRSPEFCNFPDKDWVRWPGSRSCYRLFKHSEPISWEKANEECLSKRSSLVSINSNAEMRDLTDMVLYYKKWQDELYSSAETFVYIGLTTGRYKFEKDCKGGANRTECLLWRGGRNTSSFTFIWSTDEPFTYQEWYPSHIDSLFARVPNNLLTVVQENFPQPNYFNSFLCVGMMLQNPRHHSNWVQVPCTMAIHGQSHICEKPADPEREAKRMQKHFAEQVQDIWNRTNECLDGWYQVYSDCYMLVSAPPQTMNLTIEDAPLLCMKYNASIAKAENDTQIYAMLRYWKYTLNRGDIYRIRNGVVSAAGYAPEWTAPAATLMEMGEGIGRLTEILPPRAVLCHRLAEDLPVACDGHEFRCDDHTCLSSDYACNGIKDCPGALCTGFFTFTNRTYKPANPIKTGEESKPCRGSGQLPIY